MLEVTGATKSYGGVLALSDVSFSARPGEMVAVLGENGAGKSTLLRILAGATRPDAGSITLDGKALSLKTPRDALSHGIVLIPQELAYVPGLSVAENIMLGRPARIRGLASERDFRRRAAPFARQLGVDGLLESKMSALSLAEAQLVEIAKALARDARVLLLDEPTAALSGVETERLFTTLTDLRRRSISLVYISHRLDEVMEHSDRVMVMRDGRATFTKSVAEVTKADLIAGMLGRVNEEGPLRRTTRSAEAHEAVPAVRAVDLGHHGTDGAQGISIDVRPGEVVGVYGIRGAGHEALIEAIAGVRPHDFGELFVTGRSIKPIKSIRQALAHGIGYIPPDRKKGGLVLNQSITSNLSLPQLRLLSRAGWMVRRREVELLKSVAAGMNLRYRNGSQAVSELSGGNQQKVLVGSRLSTNPKVLAIHEPTRGVDVGARREIHQLLVDMADRGSAVIVATTDIEEAVELSDRLAIVRDGVVVTVLAGSDKTQERALHEAVGGD